MKNILRPFRAFALVALSILAGIGAANGATLYVATTGSNATGNGSLNNPWATIQFAINNAAFTPGSEIIVQDGQYAPFYVDKSGSTAALRYTIRAAGSNARIFDTVVYDGRPASIHVSRSYVTIDGFIVDANKTVGDSDGVRSRGIRVSGLPTAHVIDVRILNNKVSNAGWVGISTSYAQDVLIEGNEISNSKGQHGLYVANSADGPIIRRNVSHHNAWAGIQINADPETTEDDPVDGIITNALVEQNISYSNGIGGTGTVGGNPNTGGGGSFDFASIRNSRIINNLSYDNQRQGIVLWDDGYGDAFGSKNNLIANNTVVMPAGTGHAFSIRNGSTGNTVRNNILIHLDSSNNDSIAIDPESLTGTFVSNYNIVTRFEDTGGNIVNLVTWRSQTGQDANSFTGTTSIFTNFAARDFTLASGSAAINAGTTVALVTTDILGTARPQGAGYDIGAYERVTVVAMPPGAPTIGTATRGNGQATVSFTPPASNGGATITSYTVTCTPGAGSFTGSGAGSPVVVTGLTNGTAYNCSVTATNSAGTGPASGTVSVTPATVPGTPSIASATPGNGTATITINAPASNGGSALLGYTVVCSAPGQTTQTLIGTPSPAVVSNLANGATYSCTAAAINDVGTGAASTAASVTPVGPPGAPLSVSATASPGQISVSFSPPSSNGGSAITSYNATCGAQSASGSNSPIVVA
ncbi:MAG: fibronectin type III domain-containing protein, partial [Betaproteobacteria bacterium]|nr:fibronectin type III domain-containing protein [Betaproteobacteria bacterium]